MSVSVSFQDFILSKLTTNEAVIALVGNRIYDGPPASPQFPYISLGSTDFRPDDAECIASREETSQIDCWTRKNGRKWPCKEIVDAVVNALRNQEGELSDGYLVEVNIELARVMDDLDGITVHGVVQCTGLIDEFEHG